MQGSRFWKILRVPRGEYQNIQHFFVTSSIGGISNQLHLHLAKLVTPLLKAKLLVIICKFTPKLKRGANLGFEGTTPPPQVRKKLSAQKRGKTIRQ